MAKLAHQKRGKPRPWRSLYRVASIGQGDVEMRQSLRRTGEKPRPADRLPYRGDAHRILDEEYPGS